MLRKDAEMNYSKQREAVRQVVLDSHTHPTAEEVHVAAKQVIPDIGLSTVYRNLSSLVEMGDIRRVSIPGGPERFDGFTDRHDHAICQRCGKIFDVTPSNESGNREFMDLEGLPQGFIPSASELCIYGICTSCSS